MKRPAKRKPPFAARRPITPKDLGVMSVEELLDAGSKLTDDQVREMFPITTVEMKYADWLKWYIFNNLHKKSVNEMVAEIQTTMKFSRHQAEASMMIVQTVWDDSLRFLKFVRDHPHVLNVG
jgi:tyrosyl-tRNA synthetase